MPIFVGRVPSCLVATASTRVCIYVIKEDLLLHRLKEDLMVACDGEPASLDYVITSILLPVFIALPDNAKSRQRLMRVVIPIKASLSIRFVWPFWPSVSSSCSLFRLYVFVCNDVERVAWETSMTIDGHIESLTVSDNFISHSWDVNLELIFIIQDEEAKFIDIHKIIFNVSCSYIFLYFMRVNKLKHDITWQKLPDLFIYTF